MKYCVHVNCKQNDKENMENRQITAVLCWKSILKNRRCLSAKQ